MLSHRIFKRRVSAVLRPMQFPIVGLFVLTTLLSSATHAAAEPKDFSIGLSTQLWASGVEGDVGIRGITADVDASFIDILESTDSVIGLQARLDFRKGRWGVFVDGLYQRLGGEGFETAVGGAETTFDMAIIDFGVLYRLGTWPAGDGKPSLTLDALAGGRYTYLEIEFDFDIISSRSQNENWVDPIIGLEAIVDFTDHWRLTTHGDIGGFGVSSDLTWSLSAALGYRFHLGRVPSEFFIGYKALGTDFTENSGDREFTWDTVLHGPLIGLRFTF